MISAPRSALVLIPSLFLAVACDADADADVRSDGGLNSGSDAGGADKLEHRVFVAQEITKKGQLVALEPGTQLEIRIGESPHVGASAGCNSMDGEYAIENHRFLITSAHATEIACKASLADQDEWYFSFLASSPTLTIDGDSLVLEGDTLRLSYLDRENAAIPNLELAGPLWVVDTLIAGESASSSDWDPAATLEFKADGKLLVHTGCNSGEANYVVSGSQISFDSVLLTEIDCDEEQSSLKDCVTAALSPDENVQWSISENRLTLQGEFAGLGLVATP